MRSPPVQPWSAWVRAAGFASPDLAGEFASAGSAGAAVSGAGFAGAGLRVRGGPWRGTGAGASGDGLASGLPEPRITDLVPIPLDLGVNRIPRFAPDGRDGMIVLAWHDEGGGSGHDVFLVTMPSRSGMERRDVGVSGGGDLSRGATIRDDPNHGDNMLRSVRFARGRVDGRDATLLLVATRTDAGDNAPSLTLYEVYRLIRSGDADMFAHIASRVLPDRYCNADLALSVASGLPLRRSYRGPRGADGGFTQDGCRDPYGMSGPPSRAAAPRRSNLTRVDILPQAQKEQLFEQFLDWHSAR